jgi:hypothetical protein
MARTSGLDQPGRCLGRDAQVVPVPGAAICPGGPRPLRPTRVAAVATRSHDGSGSDSAMRGS